MNVSYSFNRFLLCACLVQNVEDMHFNSAFRELIGFWMRQKQCFWFLIFCPTKHSLVIPLIARRAKKTKSNYKMSTETEPF